MHCPFNLEFDAIAVKSRSKHYCSRFMKYLTLLLLGILYWSPIAAEESLKLTGADGHEHTPLVVPAGKKAAILLFVSPYCPTANTFMPEINRITADYGGDFAFYLVHSDPEAKQADVLQHTEMHEIKVPVLFDKEQQLARRAGARITPEVVVVAADGTTLYQGRINDLYLGPTKRQRQATTKDLRDALDAIKEGKSISVPRTEAMGCKIGGMK